MQTDNNAVALTPSQTVQDEPVILLKRIGSTTYKVNIHFSKTSTESMADKVTRLIKREAA